MTIVLTTSCNRVYFLSSIFGLPIYLRLSLPCSLISQQINHRLLASGCKRSSVLSSAQRRLLKQTIVCILNSRRHTQNNQRLRSLWSRKIDYEEKNTYRLFRSQMISSACFILFNIQFPGTNMNLKFYFRDLFIK